MQFRFFPFFRVVLLSFLICFSIEGAQAEPEPITFSTRRFTLYFGSQGAKTNQERIVRNVAKRSIAVLDKTYEELSEQFSFTPTRNVVLRFLPPRQFRQETGAPAWTSAMYYRGEISIPFDTRKGINSSELTRALRHEYVHAVIAEISSFTSPAWLDEGIAQLLEGRPNPLLGPSLRDWIKKNEAMPLAWLQHGFTSLDSSIVPAAYAQSLFATRMLVDEHGYPPLINYLRLLGRGVSDRRAFRKAFGETKANFEERLTPEIERWARSGQRHP